MSVAAETPTPPRQRTRAASGFGARLGGYLRTAGRGIRTAWQVLLLLARRAWRVASLMVSTSSGLSAMERSWRNAIRRAQVCAQRLNGSLQERFDVEEWR